MEIHNCLKNYIKAKELITIDMEYPGWQADIKTYLIPLLRLEYKNFDKNIIQFSEISKNSRAHKVAISTFRQETKPNKILNKEEILKWLK